MLAVQMQNTFKLERERETSRSKKNVCKFIFNWFIFRFSISNYMNKVYIICISSFYVMVMIPISPKSKNSGWLFVEADQGINGPDMCIMGSVPVECSCVVRQRLLLVRSGAVVVKDSFRERLPSLLLIVAHTNAMLRHRRHTCRNLPTK